MKFQTIGLTTLLLCSVFATAPVDAQDRTGFAISAGLGAAQIRDRDSTDTFDGNALGFSLDFEYRFTDHLALGVGGFSLGTAEDIFDGVNTEITAKGFGFYGRAIAPISEAIEFYGRVGVFSYTADLEPGGNNGFGDDAVEFGAGLDLGRSESISFRIEARYFDGVRDESGALLTAGFSYRF